MNPDTTNVPPTPEPVMPTEQPATDIPIQQPVESQPVEFEQPIETTEPIEPTEPIETQPIAEPQPMFSPMTPSMPGQPSVPSPSPIYTPPASAQQSKKTNKKKIFLIAAGLLILLLVIVGLIAAFASKPALIGPLSQDSYEGLNYVRPTTWVKDTTEDNAVGYHPKSSLGKGTDSLPTYSLKMNVSAQKNIFKSTPNKLKPADKTALQVVIDKEINTASKDLLPAKSKVGCDTDPAYNDKPRKVALTNSFLAVKYSFTCNSGTGSSETTFYYAVIDVVPNDRDIEYVLNIGAASKKVYETNLKQIDGILNSVSF